MLLVKILRQHISPVFRMFHQGRSTSKMFQILPLEHVSGMVWRKCQLSQSVNFRYNHYAAVAHWASNGLKRAKI